MSEAHSAEELRRLYGKDYVERLVALENARLARLVPHFDLRSTHAVADLACGAGQLLDHIHDRVAIYVGVDFSSEFIEVAEERAREHGFDHARFVCQDLVAFCRAHPRAFDRIFTLDFSEHIYDPQFLEIYSAIRKSLKPEGILYLHTPNGAYFLEILKRRGILKQFPEHVAVRTGPENEQLLRQCGFQGNELRTLPHYMTPLRQLHFVSRIPGLGGVSAARLLVICRR